MAITVRELLVSLGINADTQGVKNFDSAIGNVKQTMLEASGSAGQLASRVGGAVTALVSMAAVAQGLRSVFEATVEFERLNAALVTVTGSEAKAEEAFSRLSQFTARTPFQINQVTDAFIKLENQGLNSSERAMTSYGDTASAMGKDLDQMIEAVADAAVGEFERLKEFGIKASSEGNKVAFTFKGQTTKIKKDAAEIEEFLIKLGEENFAGGMARQMDTLGGKVSNLKDAMFTFAVSVGQAGLSKALQELLGELIGVTNNSESLAKLIGRTLAKGVQLLTRGIRWLKDNADRLKPALKAVAIGLSVFKSAGILTGIAKAILAFNKLSLAMTGPALKAVLIGGSLLLLGLAIEDLVAFVQGRESLIGDILGDGPEAEEFREILQSIGEDLARTWEELKPALLAVWDSIKPLIPGLIRFIGQLTIVAVKLFRYFIDGLKVVGYFIGVAAAEIYLFFTETIPNAWNATVDAFKSGLKAIGNFFASIGAAIVKVWDTIVTFIKDVWQAMVDFVRSVWDGLIGFIKGAIDGFKTTVIDPIIEFIDSTIEKLTAAIDRAKAALGLDDDKDGEMVGQLVGFKPGESVKNQDDVIRMLARRRAARTGEDFNTVLSEMSVNVTVTNADPVETERAVRSGVNKGMRDQSQMLRNAQRNNGGL